MNNTDDIFRRGIDEALGDWALDNELLRMCQSPIERRFGEAFTIVSSVMNGRPIGLEWREKGWKGREPLFFQPQHRIGPYTVDFFIWWGVTESRHCAFVVECDGHEFHEKTKRQAAHDKARDRFLSARVAKVIRFTGSEIWNNPFECANEALTIADGLYCDSGMAR